MEDKNENRIARNARIRGHKLLTKEILSEIPPLYAQEETKDPMVYVKFFTPDSNWSWFATEYDPVEETFFGLVNGFSNELGYFNLNELAAINGPMGLPVERDMYYAPRRLSEVRSELGLEVPVNLE